MIMRKFIFLCLLVMLMPVSILAESVGYAVVQKAWNGYVLTFTCNPPALHEQDFIYKLNTDTNEPEWYKYGNEITSVVFDPSFKDAKPTTCYHWFYGMSNLEEIQGFKYLDTSEVTNMNGMFYGCSYLTELDLSNFNTANVTNIRRMFSECSGLKELDLSNFNTSNVTDMSEMFNECSRLTALNLSSFNTSKVTNMIWMFFDCSSLKKLDLSSFNTSNVLSIGGLFDGCSGLTEIDISSLNTSNVTDLGFMFSDCSSLKELDLSNFNTSKVTNMDYMFGGCNNLTKLDIRNFNTDKVENCGLFYDWSNDNNRISYNLKELYLGDNSNYFDEDCFSNIGKDTPCKLYIGKGFDKDVLGEKTSDGYYEWIGGRFVTADITTGIDDVPENGKQNEDDKIFDLSGRAASKNANGLLIINGKKVFKN